MFVAIFDNEEASYPIAIALTQKQLNRTLSLQLEDLQQVTVYEVSEGFEGVVKRLWQASAYYNLKSW